MNSDNKDQILECSFCLKKQWQVKKLVSGEDVYICNECIISCYELLNQHSTNAPTFNFTDIDPIGIKTFLDEYVIGQESVKEIISVAVSNHYKRLNNLDSDVPLDKSNIILIGSTGTGKTWLARTLAKKLNVPLAIADATTLTEAGYMGDDVESIVSKLFVASGHDKTKTESGIIFIDEIDKKAKKAETNSVNRDISGEGVQQSLLKLIEGDKVKISANGSKRTPQSEIIEIDTSNILFIASGSFVGLDNIIKKRIKGTTMGFTSNSLKVSNDDIIPDDLVTFGMIPELIGRLSIIAKLDDLSEELLIKIIREPKNSLEKQFKKLFSFDGIELEIKDDAIIAMATVAKENKTGARGLRNVLENILIKTQFNITNLKKQGLTKVIVNKDSVLNKTQPEYIFKVDN